MAALVAPIADIESFLRQEEDKELLRFTTAGSVDDGKSTLIGRLLYDTKGVYEDQLAAVKKASVNGNAGGMDLALITDGLRAEREQGITIDVAYRYFSTPRRKFIIADTPGHEQYTRNMATGASTADLAVILVDARNGVLAQTRRHTYIAWLLGIHYLVFAINKMDLVDFRSSVFHEIREELERLAGQLEIHDPYFVPISARDGDNVVTRSSRMPWFEGRTLLEHLETVPVASGRNLVDMRLPIQYVIRPNLDFRGFAGQLASGVLRVGDSVTVLSSGRTSRVRSIVTYDGDLQAALAPMSVTVCLEDEIDISRGDMLVTPASLPQVSRRLEAMMVWMNEKPLEPGKTYLVKHTTQQVRASVTAVRYKVDVNTYAQIPAGELRLNEIGLVAVHTRRPLFFDRYKQNRATGSFILIDPLTNETVAAGMITDALAEDVAQERVSASERWARAGHRPATVWLGEETEIAYALERKLFDRGCLVAMVPAEFAGAANDAGLIAIVVGARGANTDLDLNPETLPEEPHRAAEQICRMLEAKGYLQAPRERFLGGGGI